MICNNQSRYYHYYTYCTYKYTHYIAVFANIHMKTVVKYFPYMTKEVVTWDCIYMIIYLCYITI